MQLSYFCSMKHIVLLFIAVAFAASCGNGRRQKEGGKPCFHIETLNKTTPVKDQGGSPLCWIYAMLATIESDRLMMGDSVNLSPHYVARMALRSMAADSYTGGGRDTLSLRAMAPHALALIDLYGVMPYDSYRSECNYNVLCRRLDRLVRQNVGRLSGFGPLLKTADNMMDEAINPLPKHVYMLGAEYTPVEFAHSVCMPGDYQWLTSFSHFPFYRQVSLAVPDNKTGESFLNVPIDTLMNRMVKALRRGRSVCWEGDISEPGFLFKKGVARLQKHETDLSQQARQRMFETFRTTDDHCLELIGLAHDENGEPFFVCKNSWGTGNPYKGLMFMSFAYARMKTIAVALRSGD